MSQVETPAQRAETIAGHLHAVSHPSFSIDDARLILRYLLQINASPLTAQSVLEPGGKVICGRILTARDMIYRCEDCSMDPTCVMCAECFGTSPCRLQNHRVVMRSSGGGMCDCGDPTAWKNESFCDRHRPRHAASDCLAGIDEGQLVWVRLAVSLALHLLMKCLFLLRKFPAPRRPDDDSPAQNDNAIRNPANRRRPSRRNQRNAQPDPPESDPVSEGLIVTLSESAEWVAAIAESSDAGRRVVAQALVDPSSFPGSESILALILAVDGCPAVVNREKGEEAWSNAIRAVRLALSDPLIKPQFATILARLRRWIVLQEVVTESSTGNWRSDHPIVMEAVQVHTVMDVAQHLVTTGYANHLWSALLLALCLKHDPRSPALRGIAGPHTIISLSKVSMSVPLLLTELKYILLTCAPDSATKHLSSTPVVRSLCSVSQAVFMTSRIVRQNSPDDSSMMAWDLANAMRPLMRIVSRALSESVRCPSVATTEWEPSPWPPSHVVDVPQIVGGDQELQLFKQTTMFASIVAKCSSDHAWVHSSFGDPSKAALLHPSLTMSVGMLHHVVAFLIESDEILRPHNENAYPPPADLLGGKCSATFTLGLHRLMGLVLRHVVDAVAMHTIGATSSNVPVVGISTSSPGDPLPAMLNSLRDVVFHCHPRVTIPALMSIADDVILAQVVFWQIRQGLWKSREVTDQSNFYEKFDVVHFRSLDMFLLQVLACTVGPFRMTSRIVARYTSNAKEPLQLSAVTSGLVFILQLVSTTLHTAEPTTEASESTHTRRALREVLTHALSQGLQRHSQLSAVAQSLSADEDEAQHWEDIMIQVVRSVADEVLTQDGKSFRLAKLNGENDPSKFLHPYGVLYTEESLRKAFVEVKRSTGQPFPPPRLPNHSRILRDGLAYMLLSPATIQAMLFLLHHQADVISQSSANATPSAVFVFIDAIYCMIDAASQLTTVDSDTGAVFWNAVQRCVSSHADPQGMEESVVIVDFETDPPRGDVRFALCDAVVKGLRCNGQVITPKVAQSSKDAIGILELWLDRRKDEESAQRRPLLNKIMAVIGLGTALRKKSPIPDRSNDDAATKLAMSSLMQKARERLAAFSGTSPADQPSINLNISGVHEAIALDTESQCTICRGSGDEPLCYFAYHATNSMPHDIWRRNEEVPPIATVVLHCSHTVHVKCFSEHLAQRSRLSGRQLGDLLMQGTGYRGMLFLGGSEIVCPCCHKVASSVAYAPRLLPTAGTTHTLECWVSDAASAKNVLEVCLNAAYEASLGFNRGEDIPPLAALAAVDDGRVHATEAIVIRVMMAALIPTLKSDVISLTSQAWRPEDIVQRLRRLASIVVTVLASLRLCESPPKALATLLMSGAVSSSLDDFDASVCRVIFSAAEVLAETKARIDVDERIVGVLATEAVSIINSGLSITSRWMRLASLVMLRLVLVGHTGETTDIDDATSTLLNSRGGHNESGDAIPANLDILCRELQVNLGGARRDLVKEINASVHTSPAAWQTIAPVDLCSAVASDILHLPLQYLDVTAFAFNVKPQSPNAAVRVVCLRCGEGMFLFDNPARLNIHARSCWSGCAYFVYPSRAKILWINPLASRGAEFVAPYVDAYGEHDEGLLRGRPLHLSRNLAEGFVCMVASGNVEHETKIQLLRIGIGEV